MFDLEELSDAFDGTPPARDLALVQTRIFDGEFRPYHCVDCMDAEDQAVLEALDRILEGFVSALNYTSENSGPH